MLVICYTNHALDQFLEGLLPVTHEIVRVGSQSKNPNLNQYNIRNSKLVSNGTVRSLRHQVRHLVEKIKQVEVTLREIESNEVVLNFDIFAGVVPEYRSSWFATATPSEIVDWLFGTRNVSSHQKKYQQLSVIFQSRNCYNVKINHSVF